jgi:hypothetical protein
MATGSPVPIILNSLAPYWEQIPSQYVSVIPKAYAPSAMYAVLGTAPPSVLKLPVDWPAVKVPAHYPGEASPFRLDFRSQRGLGNSATLGAEAARGLPSGQITSAMQEDLSSPVFPSVCPGQDGFSTARKSLHRSSLSDLVLSRSKLGRRSFLDNYLHRRQVHRHRA